MAHDDTTDCLLEVQAPPVNPMVLANAAFIVNDKKSTLTEKMLAGCVLQLADSVNALIMALEHGTVTVRVRRP